MDLSNQKKIKAEPGLLSTDDVLFIDTNDENGISKIKSEELQYLKAVSLILEVEWFSESDEEAYGDL